jgi:hypothetical protein
VTTSVNPEIVWVDNDDEVRLYNPDDGEFQTFNASAAHIWRRLAAGATVDAIAQELSERFGGDDERERDVIARDVREFVEVLRARNLLVVAAEPDPEGAR